MAIELMIMRTRSPSGASGLVCTHMHTGTSGVERTTGDYRPITASGQTCPSSLVYSVANTLSAYY
eukprot:1194447-Prorocentrum_minimum.AAC.8